MNIGCSNYEAIGVEVAWLDVNYLNCLNGSFRGDSYCDNDALWSNPFTGAEQQGYRQEGFFGVWDAKAYYSTYAVNATERLRRTSQIEPFDFGYPPPPPPDCDEGYYWNESLEACVENESPILIPLQNQRVKLTDIAGGVPFDHDGDGNKESSAWTMAGEEVAFLAYDADGNGTIDSGKELFGNNTVPGKPNGFAALQALAGNPGGSLRPEHPFFARLLLWTDRNHNGVSEPSELRPASDLLGAIGLGYGLENRRDGNGNLFRYRGWVSTKGPKPLRDMEPGERKLHQKPAYDLLLCVQR